MAAFLEPSNSIFTPAEWRKLYPSAEYNKTKHSFLHTSKEVQEVKTALTMLDVIDLNNLGKK